MYTASGTLMSTPTSGSGGTQDSSFLLRFNCLFTGRGLSFPCDAQGEVNLDALSETALCNLARARLGVGRDYSVPQVVVAY